MALSEADPNGVDAHEPGSKLDLGKPPIFRGVLKYFPRAIGAISEVSAYGARKYSWGGWISVPDGIDRYADALSRHMAMGTIETTDKDTGFLHAAHAAWNALAVLELKLMEAEREKHETAISPQR